MALEAAFIAKNLYTEQSDVRFSCLMPPIVRRPIPSTMRILHIRPCKAYHPQA